MVVILKIALRNMKRRKTRYILTIIALIISVALFGGVMMVSDSFDVMMLDSMDNQLGSADILIRPANNSGGWFEPDEINSEIEDISHVESIAYRISGFNVYVSSTDSGNQFENSTSTAVYGIDHLAKDEKELGGKPYILDSVSDQDTIETLLEYNDATNGNRVIVITESLKIKLGRNFTAGNVVWLLPHEGEALGYDPRDTGTWVNYTVVAIVRDIGEIREFSSGNSLGLMGVQGPTLFASINNTHAFVDGTENHTGEYNLGVVGVDDIHKVASVVTEIEDNLNALNDGSDWKVLDLKSDNLEMIDTTMEMTQVMFSMFGGISLLLSLILLMNVFNIIKKEQEYETGMLQAIGASKSETFKLFLTQGTVMGIIGAVIGTIFSYFISYVIFSVTVDTLSNLAGGLGGGGFAPSGFEIVLLPSTLILTFALGLGTCIFASLYPSWKASRKPIIECLSPLEEKTKREKKNYIKSSFAYILGALIIALGAWLLFIEIPTGGAFIDAIALETTIAIIAPTIILLGIIWLLALMIRPLNRVFILLFSPYLRKTKLLTRRNILRHPRRTILTFSMIALTTSFLIGMSLMMDSMREGVNTTVNDFMGSDVRTFTYNTPRSFESELLNISGVDSVMGVSHQNTQIKIEDNWIGHGLLESEYNTSITMNVIDAIGMKGHDSKISIASPKEMTLNEMMDELGSGDTILIDKTFAEDYNVKVGDILPIKFSLGITLANLSAMIDMNFYNAHEDTIIVNMSVIAIIESFSGFSALDLLGMISGGKSYNMFISWATYEEIAPKSLPGGGTDMVFRQLAQTGNPMMDAGLANWFNFSTVEPLLDSINGIDYYTTRMDYITPTDDGSFTDYMTSVVGIQTNSSGKLKSDSFFGNNSLIEQKSGFIGSTMEELLNTTENVCVVDELYIKNHPGSGIGTNITIFPQQFTMDTVSVGFFPYNASVTPENYTSTSGSTTDLYLSDDVNLSYVSNHEWLAFNITTSFLTPNFYRAINVTIETSVNSTVDLLELEVLNIYTNVFETLGSINNPVEDNDTFIFFNFRFE